MTVTVVIPNYNGKEILSKNLQKILTFSADNPVIIVDDGSTDDSVNWIKKNFPAIKIVSLSKNNGFATAVNEGVKHVSTDLFMLLNHDCVPTKNYLTALTDGFSDSAVFAVGCLEKSNEYGKIVARGRGIGKFANGFLTHARGEVDKTNTLWASAGAAMFRKTIWITLGGLNTLYNPFYWEDIDISYRALKSGYKVLFNPKSIVYHYHNLGVIKKVYKTRHVYTVNLRNQILFVWLNITSAIFLKQHLLHLLLLLIKSVMRFDQASLSAIFGALKSLPRAYLDRRLNLKLFKLSDNTVLGEYSSEFQN